MNLDQIGRMLADIDRRLARVENSPRLSHAAIDDTAVEVRDGAGGLRAILGMQGDGTTAVNIVNGPPPPAPSAPILGSVLGGVTVSWDGSFADGAIIPLDWSRVEVHASTTDGFVPALETLKTTFETPQGGTAVVPCDEPVYVILVARNTSGTASDPTSQAGPLGPAPVVATDLLDGIVTELKLADDAVTEAKIAADAVGSTALQDSAVLAENLADAAVEVGKIADNAVTGPAIASEAVTAGKLAADSVAAASIQAGAVTAAKVAAGAITTDKLTVSGGANLLSDPSLEGAYTAALVSGNAFWSVDASKGNGSTKSLKVDAAAGTPTNRDLALFEMPILPGEQLFLAVDYQASSDYAGTPRIYARWEDASGGFLASGAAQASPPVLGATWQRISATVTAPPNTAKVRLNVASTGGTAGSVWFDNAAVRPVLGGTQIQDGAITTQKLVAAAVQALQIDAGAVNADKLAAGAVTTAKLDALAVTADKIAANAITVGKIAAGAVDATAIAADAITGKTITGGTITGSMIQTAESGERITLNEADANMILVYNDVEAIGELSSRGLLVKGTTGAVTWINPSTPLPQIRFDNASGTNSAFFQMAEVNPGDANLQFFTGTFAADGFTDRVWRQYMGTDFTMIERIRRSSSSAYRGGRINLRADFAEIGYMDSANAANAGYLLHQPGAVTSKGRHIVEPQAAGSDSVLHVTAQSTHTGNLLRLFRDSEKFAVDKDGNTTIAGRIKPATGESGTLSLQSGWTNYDTVNYGTAQVRKTADGRAYLIGRLQAGTTTSGTLVATLPNSSYWPVVRHPFPHRAPQGGVDVTLLVNEIGELRIYDISGTVTNLSLSAISWPLW
ncbi:hypothetical protein [Streptomyces sp. DSM 41013]